jgi:hypothetical protein
MLERRDVVGEERARRTAGIPGRIEHEVVDNELALGTEEVGQSDARLFPGSIERSEGIGLGDLNDGQVAALGGKGVAGPSEVLFLFKKGNASGAVLGGGGDLRKGGELGGILEKKRVEKGEGHTRIADKGERYLYSSHVGELLTDEKGISWIS